jgi:hypothetical protein
MKQRGLEEKEIRRKREREREIREIREMTRREERSIRRCCERENKISSPVRGSRVPLAADESY